MRRKTQTLTSHQQPHQNPIRAKSSGDLCPLWCQRLLKAAYLLDLLVRSSCCAWLTFATHDGPMRKLHLKFGRHWLVIVDLLCGLTGTFRAFPRRIRQVLNKNNRLYDINTVLGDREDHLDYFTDIVTRNLLFEGRLHRAGTFALVLPGVQMAELMQKEVLYQIQIV